MPRGVSELVNKATLFSLIIEVLLKPIFDTRGYVDLVFADLSPGFSRTFSPVSELIFLTTSASELELIPKAFLSFIKLLSEEKSLPPLVFSSGIILITSK